MASAQRYALPLGMRGKPTKKKHTQTRLTHRARSGPELLVLNQSVKWRDVTDRARSKSGEFCEGTRYCRAIQPIACAAAGVKHFGWEKLLSLPTFFAAAKKVGAAPHRGNANRPTR
jgi:hypothetical protein